MKEPGRNSTSLWQATAASNKPRAKLNHIVAMTGFIKSKMTFVDLVACNVYCDLLLRGTELDIVIIIYIRFS